MDNETKKELEYLVEGIEQSLIILASVLAENGDPVATLRALLLAEEAISLDLGENGWRDRIARKMQLIVALKARSAPQCDASTQTLIATLLKPQRDPGVPH